MELNRAGGILLHATSLPGSHGIGDLGSAADEWIDWLSEAGCRLWQILPLVPTGLGNSPYNGSSAFAGNPLLISLELLVQDELLSDSELEPLPKFAAQTVNYESVRQYKEPRLGLAFEKFNAGAAQHLSSEFDSFCSSNEAWLDDYALYLALKAMHGQVGWSSWDPCFSDRRSETLAESSHRWGNQIRTHKFFQFLFFRQWQRIRRRANSLDIAIIGDMPIFVAHDSADVWAHRDLFRLDENGNPTVIAGVPPDYFSPTGQRWGNPIYNWQVLEALGFEWWIDRLRATIAQVDYVRLDHFRGFEAFWEIPQDAPTAATGAWVKGPGEKVFNALQNELGQLPLLAEDLGVITPEVVALRDQFELPGMRILQFGLEGGLGHADIPDNYVAHCVGYTGTHDNNTSRGWFEASSSEVQAFARRYLSCSDDNEIAWHMITSVWTSAANWAIAPLQDFLQLGSEARMNFPGTIEGNWVWRAAREQLSDDLAARIRELSRANDR